MSTGYPTPYRGPTSGNRHAAEQLEPEDLLERIVELVFGLLILGFIVQIVVATIRPYIPYAVLGLVIVGVGSWIYRRKSHW